MMTSQQARSYQMGSCTGQSAQQSCTRCFAQQPDSLRVCLALEEVREVSI